MNDRAASLPVLGIAAVAVLALAASGNSIVNGFTYDDVALIQNDARVHSWTDWWREFARTYWPAGDGYRPLTMLAWRAQWTAGHGAPWVFHGINVVLHVTTSITVLWMTSAMLPRAAAWTAAALYAVHPVHVEATANVVGQSELAVALLVVLSLGVYVQGRRRGKLAARDWVWIAAMYAAACLFKEHAVVLPALVLLAEATVVSDAQPLRTRLQQLRPPLLAVCAIGALYLLVRSRVVPDALTGFRPFVVFEALQLSSTDRVLTMIGAAPEWFRLLLWPARLVTQYAPPGIEVAQGLGVRQIPGFLLIAGSIGLAVACWRRSPATSFGIGWTILTLLPASNVPAPAGFIIAERTLLLPSVGAMIAVASALWWIWQAAGPRSALRVPAVAALGVVLALGIARSYTRNRVWHDDDRLWRQGVLDSPDSYLAHFRLGLHLLSNGEQRAGEAHYRRAIELFPHDPIMAYSFAEQLRVAGRCDAAMPIYHWVFDAWPDSRRGHIGYATCLLGKGQYDEARREALVWIRRGGRFPLARAILAAAKAGRDSASARRRALQ
jgi:hypothetical protein